jgi:hypothetical protein
VHDDLGALVRTEWKAEPELTSASSAGGLVFGVGCGLLLAGGVVRLGWFGLRGVLDVLFVALLLIAAH